jgi:periplasmic protein TonB
MFRTLIESTASRQRRTGAALLSFLSHIGILTGAALVTAGRSIAAPRDPVRVTTVTYVDPRKPVQRQGDVFPRRRIPFPCRVCFAGVRVVPSSAPTTLPSLDALDPTRQGDLAPRWCTRVADCSVVQTAVDSGAVPGDGAVVVSAEILTQLRSGPPPRYPEPLRSAGIDGRVVIQFVVDTLGAIEPASVKVIHSSHDLFTRSVEAVLPRYRFAPSEVNGRRVRALAQMPFEFHLTK